MLERETVFPAILMGRIVSVRKGDGISCNTDGTDCPVLERETVFPPTLMGRIVQC